MNKREALEKISNISEINDCTCFYEDFKNCDTCDANKGCAYYIATQALAPQECDVNYEQKFKEADATINALGSYIYNPTMLLHCIEQYLNNNFNKQLHSQEKTFTLEEVRRIINIRIEKYAYRNNYYDKLYSNELKSLLAEFEKAVEYEQ